MEIKCYKYTLADNPFLVFNAKTANDMIERLAKDIGWHDYPNGIWVKIGSENSLIYDPMLDTFKDWNGYRFSIIDSNRVNYYFNR